MSGERTLAGASAELKNEIVNTSSGYGGISEKISRLNDILKSLEARRSASTPISYDTCPPIWPPPLYNCASLLETRAALERSSTTRDTPHGMLNALPRSHDDMLDTLPFQSSGGAVLDTLTRHHHASRGVLDMPTRKHHLRGGGMFDTLTRHQHVPRGHGVLSMLTQKHHVEEHGVFDTLSRHQHTDLGVFDTLTRHHARESRVRDTLMRRHHARAGGVLDTLPRHHVEGGGVLDTVARHRASTPRASSLHTETDFYEPTYCPHLIRASPTQRNNNIHEATHDYCHTYEPSQYGYFSASGDHHLQKHRAPSTEFLSPNKECTKSFLNVAEMAHEILARLERLETTSKRPKLQRTLSKKGAVRKGGDRKLSRQERGLLQAVRRRAKNGTLHAHEGQASPRTGENGVDEITKRVQRLESELELCWSAINQLCIDNEQFREEQRRLTRRIGPLHQRNNTHVHAKSNCNSLSIKDDFKTKKRGGKSTFLDGSLMQDNDSSG